MQRPPQNYNEEMQTGEISDLDQMFALRRESRIRKAVELKGGTDSQNDRLRNHFRRRLHQRGRLCHRRVTLRFQPAVGAAQPLGDIDGKSQIAPSSLQIPIGRRTFTSIKHRLIVSMTAPKSFAPDGGLSMNWKPTQGGVRHQPQDRQGISPHRSVRRAGHCRRELDMRHAHSSAADDLAAANSRTIFVTPKLSTLPVPSSGSFSM